MAARLVLVAMAALALSACGQDKFDQRYRDAEARIRQEDKALASELPSDAPTASSAAGPAGNTAPPR
jgi:hypothetical protein